MKWLKNPLVSLLTLVAVVFTLGFTGPVPAFALTGTIQVNSVVVNDNGGTRTADSFDLFVREESAESGTPVVSGETNTFVTPLTYFVGATGDDNYTRSFSGDCNADGMIALADGAVAVCTVTNDDIGEGGGGDTDTTPDQFTFTDQTGAPLSTQIESDEVIVGGINAAADISVVGGEFSVNGSAYTDVSGTVEDGDTVRVRHVSSDTNETAVDTTLTIGGVSDTFTSTTLTNGGSGDATIQVNKVVVNDDDGTMAVEDFDLFVSVLGADTGTFVVSGEANPFGAPATYRVTESGDAGYSFSFSGDCDTDGIMELNPGDDLICTITNNDVGEGGGGGDTTPDQFEFIDHFGVALNTVIESDPITIEGIDTATDISVTGGEFSIDGGTFTSTSGTVEAGASVIVRGTSASTNVTPVDVTLTVGGVSDTFTIMTTAAEQIIDEGAIQVNKIVINDDDGTRTADSFELYVILDGEENGTLVLNGESNFFPAPATYRISESGDSNYTFSFSGDCSADGVIELDIDDDVICTITNNDIDGGGGGDTDTMPDAFSFEDQTDVALETVIESNEITVSGINAPADISVTGGEYSVNGGDFTSEEGTVEADDTVVVRHTSADTDGTDVDTTLTIGGISDTFTSTTQGEGAGEGDTTIRVVKVVVNDDGGTRVVSDFDLFVTLVGEDDGTYVISGETNDFAAGSYRVTETGDQSYQKSFSGDCDADGFIDLSEGEEAICTITNDDEGDGGNNGDTDTTPNSFVFTDQTGVTLNTTVESDEITVSGINAETNISVTGGEFSVNGGTFTSTSGTVEAGDTVRVRHTSALTNSTAVNTTLTIGGVSDTFTSTTLSSGGSSTDTTPDQFSFIDQTGVATSTVIVSNSFTVSGINSPTTVSVTGGEYSINGSGTTTASGIIHLGDTVRVLHTSAATTDTSVHTTLTIGGVSDTFTSTTMGTSTTTPDTTPDQFTFTDQTGVTLNTLIVSNAVTVLGIDATTTISVTGGAYSVNGMATTTASGTVTAGDVIRVQHTSSGSHSTAVNTTLTIGGVSDTFTSTTRAFVPIQNGGGSGRSRSRGTTINQSVIIGGNNSGTINVIGQVLGFANDAEREAQITAVRSQLVTLITQLIGLLQIQIANANAQQ